MVHPGSELAVELCGRELATPIMNAAGTLDLRGPTSDGAFGALIPKTVTASERRGNSPPVLKQLEQGWINAVGLKNPGLDVLLRNLDVYDVGLPIIVSIANYTPVGFAKMCKQLAEDPRVWAVELNLSCPNAGQGYTFCDNPYAVRSAVRAAKWALKGKPVFAKLGYEGVRENARVAVEAGAAALTLINTLPALHVDPTSRAVFAGGLSGCYQAPRAEGRVRGLPARWCARDRLRGCHHRHRRCRVLDSRSYGGPGRLRNLWPESARDPRGVRPLYCGTWFTGTQQHSSGYGGDGLGSTRGAESLRWQMWLVWVLFSVPVAGAGWEAHGGVGKSLIAPLVAAGAMWVSFVLIEEGSEDGGKD